MVAAALIVCYIFNFFFFIAVISTSADGQAIAKKLCGQISKTTNSMQQLIKQYGRGEALTGCKYPNKVILQESLDITSSLWNVLDDSSLAACEVPYCIKRQRIDLNHLLQRCTEEYGFIKEEMTRVETFYQRKHGSMGKLKYMQEINKVILWKLTKTYRCRFRQVKI